MARRRKTRILAKTWRLGWFPVRLSTRFLAIFLRKLL